MNLLNFLENGVHIQFYQNEFEKLGLKFATNVCVEEKLSVRQSPSTACEGVSSPQRCTKLCSFLILVLYYKTRIKKEHGWHKISAMKF